MSLPNATDLGTLDYSDLGLPFVSVETRTGQNTNSLDWSYLGLPFVGAPVGAIPPPAYNTTQFFMVF
jgi:hypothetical protein